MQIKDICIGYLITTLFLGLKKMKTTSISKNRDMVNMP